MELNVEVQVELRLYETRTSALSKSRRDYDDH